MLRTLVAAAAMVLAWQSGVPTSTTARIAPLFTVIDNGPVFLVECANTTGQTRSSGELIWAGVLRIDGRSVQPDYGMGPGLRTEVQAGATWRGIIALRQSYQPYFPAVNFGALVRRAPTWPLASGRHTIAVQCPSGWSNDLEFYWEGESVITALRTEPADTAWRSGGLESR